MCLDLDHFKTVNDTLGHPTGDKLLCAAAERLSACVRGQDTVARFGGDEFAILLPSIDDRAAAEALGRRIVEEMSRPFDLSNDRVHVTSSVGIAFSNGVGDDADRLLKNADLALYEAKGDGRHTHRFFEPEMEERLSIRHGVERDLRLAIASGQFELHYQPVVELRSRRITGFEALIRWNHPMRGTVAPSDFISVAEETGLICDIGRFVLRRACSDMARWPGDLKIAVNLSAAQFTQSDVVADVSEALDSAHIPAQRLVVEITESLLLREDRATLDKLRALKALGVEIAMDDFGTGYSSLSYLRNYPFSRIKIDRSFVQTAGDGGQGTAIVRTIVDLGRSLGMMTVAEGIETEEELRLLQEARCTEGQGYLFSPPVPRDQVPALIAQQEGGFSKVA
jgi:diguanylate cyclase (GGDEF)-like protein